MFLDKLKFVTSCAEFAPSLVAVCAAFLPPGLPDVLSSSPVVGAQQIQGWALGIFSAEPSVIVAGFENDWHSIVPEHLQELF